MSVVAQIITYLWKFNNNKIKEKLQKIPNKIKIKISTKNKRKIKNKIKRKRQDLGGCVEHLWFCLTVIAVTVTAVTVTAVTVIAVNGFDRSNGLDGNRNGFRISIYSYPKIQRCKCVVSLRVVIIS
jgi:hypothetical protein